MAGNARCSLRRNDKGKKIFLKLYFKHLQRSYQCKVAIRTTQEVLFKNHELYPAPTYALSTQELVNASGEAQV